MNWNSWHAGWHPHEPRGAEPEGPAKAPNLTQARNEASEQNNRRFLLQSVTNDGQVGSPVKSASASLVVRLPTGDRNLWEPNRSGHVFGCSCPAHRLEREIQGLRHQLRDTPPELAMNQWGTVTRRIGPRTRAGRFPGSITENYAKWRRLEWIHRNCHRIRTRKPRRFTMRPNRSRSAKIPRAIGTGLAQPEIVQTDGTGRKAGEKIECLMAWDDDRPVLPPTLPYHRAHKVPAMITPAFKGMMISDHAPGYRHHNCSSVLRHLWMNRRNRLVTNYVMSANIRIRNRTFRKLAGENDE